MMSPGLAALSIAEIRFEGFSKEESATLAQASGLQINEQYDPERIRESIDRLYEYFFDQDQYFVSIPLPDLIPLSDSELALSFSPIITQDSSQIKIRYLGLRHFSESKLHDFAYTSFDKTYPLAEVEQIMRRVLAVYHQRGYLFASVRLDSLVMSEDLTAWLRIDEGGIFNPQNFHFQGNKSTRESSLLKSSGLLRQSVLTPSVLEQAEQNIKAKSYIRDCTIMPLDEDNLLIRIQEGRMTFLEGVLGIGDNEGRNRLSGMINIEFLNLWGTDRGVRLYWRRTPSDYSVLSLSYHESGHPELPLAADISVARTVQDSLWIRSEWNLDLYLQSLYNKLGIGFANRNISPGSTSSQIEKDRSSSVGSFWKYQNTRGEIIPTKGNQFSARYDYIFDEPKNYGKLSLSSLHLIPIHGRFIGFMGANYMGSKNRNLKEYDLYTMGGFGSLRGYREDELKSHSLGWINCELRYMVNPETMLYLFYDHGALNLPDKSLKTDLLALGFGIKLGTRLGVMSIDYGLGYRDNGLSDIGLGMVHLGLDIAL